MGLLNPKKRKKFTLQLAHCKHLDARFMFEITGAQSHPPDIERLLRSKGAPVDCYVISEYSEWDGKFMPLAAALKGVVGYDMGTVVSCIPGKLAYYEDEAMQPRFMLLRS